MIRALGFFGCVALAACGSQSAAEGGEGVSSAELGFGSYTFGTMGATKCMSVAGGGSADGTNIRQWTCIGTGAQLFRVEQRAAGGVRIVNPQSNKCVDVDGNRTADGTNVQLWTCNGTDAQNFRIDDVSGGIRIVHPASGKCIDVAGAGTTDGTNIQLWTCNGTPAQVFKPTARVPTINVMPLGASITQGYGGTHAGYRFPLGVMMNQHGVAHLFVGSSIENPGPLVENQRHHEGHPGFMIAGDGNGHAGLLENLGQWLGASGANPDFILLLVGSNDIGMNYDLAHAGDRMDALITRISNKTTGLRPNAHLVVSTLPLINDATQEARVKTYNAAIVAVADRHRAAGENVSTVDVHAVITPSDKYDNLHPNDSGYDKIATVFYKAIADQ